MVPARTTSWSATETDWMGREREMKSGWERRNRRRWGWGGRGLHAAAMGSKAWTSIDAGEEDERRA